MSLGVAALATALVVGDGIPQPLTAVQGDPGRGRAIVVDRQQGMCLLCHGGPFPEEPSPGTVAGSLAGAGARWTDAQLRLRVADARRLDPRSVMPSYHLRAPAEPPLQRVAPAWQDRPILDAQQVEDVVAFLKTLR